MRFLAMAVLALIAATGLAQPAPVTLDSLVSMERQQALGLDQLTPQQRAGIVRLLQEVHQQGLEQGRKSADPPRSTLGLPPEFEEMARQGREDRLRKENTKRECIARRETCKSQCEGLSRKSESDSIFSSSPRSNCLSRCENIKCDTY